MTRLYHMSHTWFWLVFNTVFDYSELKFHLWSYLTGKHGCKVHIKIIQKTHLKSAKRNVVIFRFILFRKKRNMQSISSNFDSVSINLSEGFYDNNSIVLPLEN